MFSETKVTEIYYIADDFCKEFALQQEKFIVFMKVSQAVPSTIRHTFPLIQHLGKSFE